MGLKQQEQQTSSLKKRNQPTSSSPLSPPEDLIPALQPVILKAAFEALHSVVKSVAGHPSDFRASLLEGAELQERNTKLLSALLSAVSDAVDHAHPASIL